MSAPSRLPVAAAPSNESGRGQPHSKTFRNFAGADRSRSVLECGGARPEGPLPLFLMTSQIPSTPLAPRTILTIHAPCLLNDLDLTI